MGWILFTKHNVCKYCKTPKISDIRKIAVIILKFEQGGFTVE